MALPRRVAVSIVFSPCPSGEAPCFLVVSSRRHAGRFVFPKGGIEAGERAEEAALREAWEEAGLLPNQATHIRQLSVLPCPSPHPDSPTKDLQNPQFVPSSVYYFQLFLLPRPLSDALSATWPEENERTRNWVQGWEEVERVVCWGKRSHVMRQAIHEARARLHS